MKIAVIGLGRRMSYVLEHVENAFEEANENLQIAGYYDVREVELTNLKHCAIKRFDNIEVMMREVQPDAVFIGSPNHSHFDHIKAALKHDVRIFTEKPVVRTAEETMELYQLLKEYDADHVLVGFPLRSAPAYRGAKKYLDKIGPIQHLKVKEFLHPSHGHYICVEDWRRYQRYAGSFLLDKTVHDFDLFQQIVQSPVQWVESEGQSDIFVEGNLEYLKEIDQAYDAFNAEIAGMRGKMSNWNASENKYVTDGDIRHRQTVQMLCQNGAQIEFHASLLSESLQPERSIEVIGENGNLLLDFVRNEITYTCQSGEVLKEEYKPCLKTHYGADPEMARDLLKTMLYGTDYPNSILDGLKPGLVVMYADKACDLKQRVYINDPAHQQLLAA